MFNKLSFVLVLAVMLTTAFMSGCSMKSMGDKTVAVKPADSKSIDAKPVTIKLFATVPLPEEDYQLLFVEPVKKKYPNITLENLTAGGTNIDNLITANQVPDILIGTNTYVNTAMEKGLTYDITPLVKNQNVDLNRFESYILDGFKSEKGELFALPYSVNSNVTFYNKDIFDKFGVAYPKDGMFWEDAMELAKKVSRMDGGVQYRGLDPESISRLSAVLSLTPVDAKTDKARIDSPKWKNVFETLHSIFSLPGNTPPDFNHGTLAVEPIFMKDRTLAMFPTVSNVMTRISEATANGLNWDIVQYPSFKEKPDTYMYLDAHGLYITRTSEHKNQAMQVITTVTSDEVQTISTRQRLRITTLKNPEIKKQFAADVSFMKGKHIESIFKGRPAVAPVLSQYHGKAMGIMANKFIAYMKGDMDVNTALRQAEEEINKMIESSR